MIAVEKREVRRFPAHLTLRASGSGSIARGHAATFDVVYDLGDIDEMMSSTAFDGALTDDVRALWNHDPNIILGRTKSGTLRLEKDSTGLAVEIELPKSATTQREAIARGDVDQMSVGFIVRKDRWETQDNGRELRIIEAVELFDVSPVTFPANPSTDISIALRSKKRAERRKIPGRTTGRGLTAKDRKRILREKDPTRSRPKISAPAPENDPLWSLAVHEASHALVSTLRGYGVRSVGVRVWTDGKPHPGGYSDALKPVDGVVRMAGLAGEIAFGCSPDLVSAGRGDHDERQARTLAASEIQQGMKSKITPDSAFVTQRCRDWRKTAERMIGEHRTAVRELAKALVRHRQLTGSEVEGIISTHAPRAA